MTTSDSRPVQLQVSDRVNISPSVGGKALNAPTGTIVGTTLISGRYWVLVDGNRRPTDLHVSRLTKRG